MKKKISGDMWKLYEIPLLVSVKFYKTIAIPVCISMAASTLWQQSSVVVRESIWPTQATIFFIWLVTESLPSPRINWDFVDKLKRGDFHTGEAKKGKAFIHLRIWKCLPLWNFLIFSWASFWPCLFFSSLKVAACSFASRSFAARCKYLSFCSK